MADQQDELPAVTRIVSPFDIVNFRANTYANTYNTIVKLNRNETKKNNEIIAFFEDDLFVFEDASESKIATPPDDKNPDKQKKVLGNLRRGFLPLYSKGNPRSFFLANMTKLSYACYLAQHKVDVKKEAARVGLMYVADVQNNPLIDEIQIAISQKQGAATFKKGQQIWVYFNQQDESRTDELKTVLDNQFASHNRQIDAEQRSLNNINLKNLAHEIVRTFGAKTEQSVFKSRKKKLKQTDENGNAIRIVESDETLKSAWDTDSDKKISESFLNDFKLGKNKYLPNIEPTTLAMQLASNRMYKVKILKVDKGTISYEADLKFPVTHATEEEKKFHGTLLTTNDSIYENSVTIRCTYYNKDSDDLRTVKAQNDNEAYAPLLSYLQRRYLGYIVKRTADHQFFYQLASKTFKNMAKLHVAAAQKDNELYDGVLLSFYVSKEDTFPVCSVLPSTSGKENEIIIQATLNIDDKETDDNPRTSSTLLRSQCVMPEEGNVFTHLHKASEKADDIADLYKTTFVAAYKRLNGDIRRRCLEKEEKSDVSSWHFICFNKKHILGETVDEFGVDESAHDAKKFVLNNFPTNPKKGSTLYATVYNKLLYKFCSRWKGDIVLDDDAEALKFVAAYLCFYTKETAWFKLLIGKKNQHFFTEFKTAAASAGAHNALATMLLALVTQTLGVVIEAHSRESTYHVLNCVEPGNDESDATEALASTTVIINPENKTAELNVSLNDDDDDDDCNPTVSSTDLKKFQEEEIYTTMVQKLRDQTHYATYAFNLPEICSLDIMVNPEDAKYKIFTGKVRRAHLRGRTKYINKSSKFPAIVSSSCALTKKQEFFMPKELYQITLVNKKANVQSSDGNPLDDDMSPDDDDDKDELQIVDHDDGDQSDSAIASKANSPVAKKTAPPGKMYPDDFEDDTFLV